VAHDRYSWCYFVNTIVYSPAYVVKFVNVNTVFSCSDDKSVKLWDILTAKNISTFVGHSDYVRAASIFPDNESLIASGSYDHIVKIWDIRSGKCVIEINHDKPVECIVKHPTAPIFVSGGGNYFKVWDLMKPKECIHMSKSHHNTITTLSFNHDGTRFEKFLLLLIVSKE